MEDETKYDYFVTPVLFECISCCHILYVNTSCLEVCPYLFFLTIYLARLLFLLKLSYVNNIFFYFIFSHHFKAIFKRTAWNFYCNDTENSSNKFLMTLICFLLSLAERAIYIYKTHFWKMFFNHFKTWISAYHMFGGQSQYLLKCHSTNKLTGKLILSRCIKVAECANY